jgi:hypothetical protein
MNAPKITDKRKMALKRPPEKQWVYRQPPEPYMRFPSAGCFLGPTASGKTTSAVACLLGPLNVFDAVWVFSPSALIDTAYEPLEKHFKTLKNGGGLIGEWDIVKLNEIIDEQKKVTAEEKLKNQKTPLTSTLLVLDDWTDHPEYMKTGIITQLFVRNRHYGLSVLCLSQKMTSLSLTCRVNLRWIVVWRLRSHKEIECVMHELSAIHSVQTLFELYSIAVDDQPYSFWYVNMSSQDKQKMFYIRFEEALVIE